ncbi:DUF58 domain-containing protein [Demequina sp. NBRC 110056]|uniref:DUF58 domain-containing protein n=1 Tax=Demequina sp. NBRC 110056 TaxID=1570345 RepID=UPI001F3B34DB|nr:DUF58 domain-containing protein [Demequina sp. NBRC 110056]
MTGTRTRGATVTRYATDSRGVSARVDAGRSVVARLAGALQRGWTATTEAINGAGWLLLACAAGGLLVAVAWGWSEAWFVAFASLVMLALCTPFLLGRHSYAVTLEFERDRVVAGSEFTAELVVRNAGARASLPALLDIPVGDGLIEAHIPLLRAGAEHRETLTIAAPRRGVIAVGPMTISRGDPLGVLQRDHTWPDVQHVYVHPATVPIPSSSAGLLRDLEGLVTSTTVDSDLAFHAIRDYLPGDSRRHVHWRSTAKTGQLMVRQYEETRRSRIAIALDLDISQYASEDEFEMAVSVAASLGVQAVRSGREVVITTSGAIPRHAAERVHSMTTLPTLTPTGLLDAMSGVDASDLVMPLPLVAGMTSQEAHHLSMVFLVTGSELPVARLRQAAVAFSADVSVVGVRSETGAQPTVRSARELRVLTVGMLHDLSHLMLRGPA